MAVYLLECFHDKLGKRRVATDRDGSEGRETYFCLLEQARWEHERVGGNGGPFCEW